jgi:cytochrome c oxidase assembly protein subunit 11
MNSFPRFLGGLSRNDAVWTCSSCAKAIHRKPVPPFFNHSQSMKRGISNSTKTRQNVAPTMEQLRAPFLKKNNSTLYYTLSIILGTVAFSYGSVPMYKMVFGITPHMDIIAQWLRTDLPNNRLGRPTYQSTWTWWSGRQ